MCGCKDFYILLQASLHLFSLVDGNLWIPHNPICKFLILFLSYQNPSQIGFAYSYTHVLKCFPLEVSGFGVIY